MTGYDGEVPRLSDQQERTLAVLPIPSAFLSIVGSSLIVFMIFRTGTKKQRQWSPYKRLLLMMSLCDIMFSLTIGVAAFLRPQESSKRLWAFGTEATCTTVGFFNQLSISARLYNGSLSVYFLMTTRFGMKNDDISRCFEPVIHTISIGFPILTGAMGSVIGLWGEMPVNGLGCYIMDYPENCGSQPGNSGEKCISSRLFTMFYSVPVYMTFAVLVVSNIMISHFVWRRTNPNITIQRPAASVASGSESSLSFHSTGGSSTNNDVEKSDRSQSKTNRKSDSSFKIGFGKGKDIGGLKSKSNHIPDAQQSSIQRQSAFSLMERRKEQRSRLRLVASQAFLFVACYTLSNLWPGLINQLKQEAKSEEGIVEFLYMHYPLMVCEAVFLPLQGIFNFLVFIRPKYLRTTIDYPEETYWWAFKRAVFGSRMKATHEDKPHSWNSSIISSVRQRNMKLSGGDVESTGAAIDDSQRTNNSDTQRTSNSDTQRSNNSDSQRSNGDTSSEEKSDNFDVSTDARLPNTSSLTSDGSDHDEEFPEINIVRSGKEETKKRRFKSREHKRNSGRSFRVRGLEVISELSVSHFEFESEVSDFIPEIKEYEDTEIDYSDEMHLNDEDGNIDVLTAETPIGRISTSSSEHRWIATTENSPGGHSLEDPDEPKIDTLEMPTRQKSRDDIVLLELDDPDEQEIGSLEMPMRKESNPDLLDLVDDYKPAKDMLVMPIRKKSSATIDLLDLDLHDLGSFCSSNDTIDSEPGKEDKKRLDCVRNGLSVNDRPPSPDLGSVCSSNDTIGSEPQEEDKEKLDCVRDDLSVSERPPSPPSMDTVLIRDRVWKSERLL